MLSQLWPRVVGLIAVLVVVTGLASACTTEPSSPNDPAASAAGGGAFPATVTTKFGDVTIATAPQRIVALGWGDAEALLALGVQAVGASDWLQFGSDGVGPWATGRYTTPPTIIGTLEPSYEAIAELAPDLILDVKSSGDAKRHELLSKIAPTIGVPPGADRYLVTVEQQMTMIATAVGKAAEGKALLDTVDQAFAAARAAHPEWAGRTVTAATRTSEGWGAYISGTERVRFLEKLGFRQSPTIAAQETGATGFSVPISTERLDLLDADLIVCFPIFIETTKITGDQFFRRIPAVVDGRSVVIDGDLSAAYSLAGVMSTQYAIERLVPLIAATPVGR